MTVAKFELTLTRCRNNVRTVGNVTIKNSLQHFDARERYLQPKNRPVSFQNRRKMFCAHYFEGSNGAVSKMCRLEFRFQNLPFSKSAGKNVLSSRECSLIEKVLSMPMNSTVE